MERKQVAMNDIPLYNRMKVQAAMRDTPVGVMYQVAARAWLEDNELTTKQWLKK